MTQCVFSHSIEKFVSFILLISSSVTPKSFLQSEAS